MAPKKQEGKSDAVFICACGYEEEGNAKITEENKNQLKDIEVVEKDVEMLPIIKNKCEKCGNKESYYWEIQTRSGDEAATRFYKCTKCKFTWREYA